MFKCPFRIFSYKLFLLIQSGRFCDCGRGFFVGRMKAVLFDVGGVLVSAPQLAIARYEKSLNLPK